MNGKTAGWADFAAMTRTAEEVGFDSVWVTDHLLKLSKRGGSASTAGGSKREIDGPWECWSLLSAIAAITDRVEIGALVICHAFRNPALLAKMADTVDEISSGRLILGLGAGWNEAEFRAFGYPFDHRVDRFEEGLQIVTSLLRTGRSDFHGRYHETDDCELRPRGPRPGGLPIVIGANKPRMIDLAVRHADMWNIWFNHNGNDLVRLIPFLEQVDAACIAAGRDPATLQKTAVVKVEIGPHAPSSMAEPPLRGSHKELADQLRAYANAGISHVQLWIEPNTVEGYRAFRPVLELLDQGG